MAQYHGGNQKLFLTCMTFGLLYCTSSIWAACPGFQNSQDVLTCALNEHPAVQQAQAKSVQGKFLGEIASQRPNPELDGNTAFGRSQGADVLNGQITLSHIFELGGKRDARIEKAQADNQVISAEVLKAKELVALNTVTSLYRLRQIQVETAALEEALHTFSRIANQLKARPRLTPDQEVVMTTFQLIGSDYRLRKKALSGEEQALLKFVELSVGAPFEARSQLLPPVKEVWPEFDQKQNPAAFQGSDINRLKAELTAAEAERSLAQSASWPNLKIGPSVQAETQAGISYQAFGIGFSLPLPLYQANGGGRAYASKGILLAELTLATAGNQLLIERQQEIIRYQAALESMAESGTLRAVEKRHQNIERLFRGGLIQSSMVIEAHRQIVELTRNVNEQELIAIRSLWRVYAIEGRVLKEKI